MPLCLASVAGYVQFQLIISGILTVEPEAVRSGETAVIGQLKVALIDDHGVLVAEIQIEHFQVDGDVDSRNAEHRVGTDADEVFFTELRPRPDLAALHCGDLALERLSFSGIIRVYVDDHFLCGRGGTPGRL